MHTVYQYSLLAFFLFSSSICKAVEDSKEQSALYCNEVLDENFDEEWNDNTPTISHQSSITILRIKNAGTYAFYQGAPVKIS